MFIQKSKLNLFEPTYYSYCNALAHSTQNQNKEYTAYYAERYVFTLSALVKYCNVLLTITAKTSSLNNCLLLG